MRKYSHSIGRMIPLGLMAALMAAPILTAPALTNTPAATSTNAAAAGATTNQPTAGKSGNMFPPECSGEKVLVLRLPRKPCFKVAGIPSRSLTDDSNCVLSVLEIPGAPPFAIEGKLNAAPGGLSEALSEIAGRTLMPATLPLWSFCW